MEVNKNLHLCLTLFFTRSLQPEFSCSLVSFLQFSVSEISSFGIRVGSSAQMKLLGIHSGTPLVMHQEIGKISKLNADLSTSSLSPPSSWITNKWLRLSSIDPLRNCPPWRTKSFCCSRKPSSSALLKTSKKKMKYEVFLLLSLRYGLDNPKPNNYLESFFFEQLFQMRLQCLLLL